MNCIPINGYESVFEPFFDGGESYADHKKFSVFKENYKVENLNCSDYKITQNWAALDIVFVPEDDNSALRLSRKCRLSVCGCDVLRVYCSVHKNCKLKITAAVDGEIKVLGEKLLSDRVEYDFPINGNEVSMLILELSGAEAKQEAFASFAWLGLCNTSKEAFENERKYEFGPDWQGCFNDENDFTVQTNAYFDNEELESLREKVKKPPFDKIFGKLKTGAEKHLNDEPEKLIEDYLLPPDNNWRRQRDLNKPFLLAGAEEMAFVGLIEKNREMLISACRKALSAAVTPFWCPSEICRMPGATWHPRCFYEMNAARILSRVYSFAGSVLTWHGKNLIKTAVAAKGLPRMEYDIGYLDYIKKCNQGIVFNSARTESYLCLASEHKGYERMLENCASDLNEMLRNYIEPDGSSLEGPMYWNYTFMYAVIQTYLLQKHFKISHYSLFDELFGKASDYALSMLSTEGDSTHIVPLNDGFEDRYRPHIAWYFYKVTNNPFWRTYYNKLLTDGDIKDSLIEIIIMCGFPDKTDCTLENEFFNFPIGGFTTLFRTDKKIGKTRLHLTSGKTYFSHYHDDKGQILLEADGKPLLIDSGRIISPYYSQKCHNLFGIHYEPNEIPDRQLCGGEGRIIKSEFKKGVFAYKTELEGVYDKNLFKKLTREVWSDSPCSVTVTDTAELFKARRAEQRFNCLGDAQISENGVLIKNGSLHLLLSFESESKVEIKIGLIGEYKGVNVNQICFVLKEAKSFNIKTNLKIFKK